MKWLALHVGGHKIGVHLVRRKHPKLDGDDGGYYPDQARIYIASDLDDGPREDALMHELMHCVLWISGTYKAIGDEDQEESFITSVIPLWHRVLKDLGFRFPRGLYQ